ncbi:MAG: ABC transporter substrate-binding protein [Candidatus Aureabacteria bacterium]|nr:ABC transporter substrate-binding protein [Candidatus Auribacterota bacterium]
MKHVKCSAWIAAVTVCLAVSFAIAQTAQQAPAKAPVANPQEGKSSPAAPAAKNSLRFISDFDSPPFSFKEGIERKGSEIDLAEAIGKELGKKIEWIEMGFNINTYESALNRGTADAAISSISITDERKKEISFTEPYWKTSLAIAVKKDVDWQHNWFTTGLKGWTLGVMRNTTGEKWAREHLDGEVKTFPSVDRLASALKNSPMPLKSGKAGFCIIHDQVILKWVLSDYSYHYEIVETDISHEYYGIAVRKGNTKLLEELNNAIEKLRAKGIGKKIHQKWFKEAMDLPMFQE